MPSKMVSQGALKDKAVHRYKAQRCQAEAARAVHAKAGRQAACVKGVHQAMRAQLYACRPLGLGTPPATSANSTRTTQALVLSTDTPMAMPTSGPSENGSRNASTAGMPLPAATNAAATAIDSTQRWDAWQPVPRALSMLTSSRCHCVL
jgi:hypothetical protein